MTGIEMMLKSMGVDPEKIRQVLTEAKEDVLKKMTSIDGRLERIEHQLGIGKGDETDGGRNLYGNSHDNGNTKLN